MIPMSLEQALTNSATGLSAQSVRMNTIASNLANAGNIGTTEQETYRSQYPLFKEITGQSLSGNVEQPNGGVQVTKIDHTKSPLERRYEPSNPMANADGYVYVTDVNPIAEMTNMMSASKEYQANVEVMSTLKNMITQGINLINTK